MSSLPIAEMKIVLLRFQRIGHSQVRERPIAVAQIQVFRALLQPNANVAFWLPQDLIGIVLPAIRHSRILFPLNSAEAAYPGNHAPELIRHVPSSIEGANSAGGQTGNGPAVGILAQV